MDGEGAEKEAGAELELLFPDRDVTVTDPETGKPVALTIREFRFREGLEAQVLARPLLDALAGTFEDGEALDAQAIDGALAVHADLWLELVALACGRTVDWLAGLSDRDGEALSDAMWSANAGFFTRRVVAEVATRKLEALGIGSRLPRSSTSSSAPDTDEATAT